MDIEIKLKLKDSKLTSIYPKFNASDNTWKLSAFPNGDILLGNRKYPYLFWEADYNKNKKINKGFIVKGEEAELFFEDKLKKLGLNEKESCDFITYWLPVLIKNKISLISFETKELFDHFQYDITPKPKSFIRVYCYIQKLDQEIQIEQHEINEIKRDGFTIVEWGATEINN